MLRFFPIRRGPHVHGTVQTDDFALYGWRMGIAFGGSSEHHPLDQKFFVVSSRPASLPAETAPHEELAEGLRSDTASPEHPAGRSSSIRTPGRVRPRLGSQKEILWLRARKA